MMNAVKLVSLNVGRPRIVQWQGRFVSTGIFKEPIAERTMLRTLNLDGDRQADLTVHGGRDKAVYAYPAEHYHWWRAELPEMNLPYAMFGENFTTTGIDESTVNIGDEFRIGAAKVVVVQPRMPCYKLGLRFGRADIIKRFHQSRRTGFYLRVLEEGLVGAGDELELIKRGAGDVTIADINRLYFWDKDDAPTLRRAVQLETLPEFLKEHFRERLAELE
jgi:MOSC domain-containing protein YiiM